MYIVTVTDGHTFESFNCDSPVCSSVKVIALCVHN